jgi:hypothetical protein
VCGQNAGFVNCEAAGMYGYHSALKVRAIFKKSFKYCVFCCKVALEFMRTTKAERMRKTLQFSSCNKGLLLTGLIS